VTTEYTGCNTGFSDFKNSAKHAIKIVCVVRRSAVASCVCCLFNFLNTRDNFNCLDKWGFNPPGIIKNRKKYLLFYPTNGYNCNKKNKEENF
jgi:hypothetical protein